MAAGTGPGGRRRTRRGELSASGPTSGRATCGQKLMATACCSVAMAEVTCGGGGGGKRPTRWPSSACCTISRSYLTISWMMAFSWLLNTPELRSCCTLCSRIEFFLPGDRGVVSAQGSASCIQWVGVSSRHTAACTEHLLHTSTRYWAQTLQPVGTEHLHKASR